MTNWRLSILVAAALVTGCSEPPSDRSRPLPPDGGEADIRDKIPDGGEADAGPNDDADAGDTGEAGTGPSGPPGFSLEGKVSSAGGPAEGGDFSLEGHISTSHSGQVCTGGGWTLEPGTFRARE